MCDFAAHLALPFVAAGQAQGTGRANFFHAAWFGALDVSQMGTYETPAILAPKSKPSSAVVSVIVSPLTALTVAVHGF
jgi:hypothetical protein